MSVVDYNQTAEHHSNLLVLVKQVGSHLQPKHFSKLYERVSKQQVIKIPRQERLLRFRYERHYAGQNNDWGDFQAHRKVLGLVCFAKCNDQSEVEELRKLYNDIKLQYSGTMFDSRLIVFGAVDDSKQQVTNHDTAGTTSTEVSPTSSDKENSNVENIIEEGESKQSAIADPLNANATNGNNANNSAGDKNPQKNMRTSPQLSRSLQVTVENGSTGSKTEGDVIFYPDPENAPDLEDRLCDFASSLFWVLESKRLDRSQERLDKLPMLMCPFERRDFVGVDTDSRQYRRRCQGRLRKQLGDLCLLAALPGEAVLHYQTAADTLRQANDWMWLAGALEGLCAASVALSVPPEESAQATGATGGFTRNQSFSVKRGASATAAGQLKPVAPGSGGGGVLPRRLNLSNGLDVGEVKRMPSPLMLPDDVVARYRDAIAHYSKFKHAGIVEMECSMKACRILTQQQKWLEASDFLQNVVYINLPLSDEEKVTRYSTLAQLYANIQMHRKAAFFRRIAAMQCVAPSNPQPGWSKCYHLLLDALDGYKLSLDPKDRPAGGEYGWAVVQLRVMHELIYSARRMGNATVAVRHLMFLLHVLFTYLSDTEKREMSAVLESYTARAEGRPQAVALDNGLILPPVPFTKFPTVRSFRLVDLPPHLRPVKLKSGAANSLKASESGNPFIYSPIVFGTDADKDASKVDFSWVEGDLCEVELQLHNPLPFELKVTNMGLMTERCGFEPYPAVVTLPPQSGVHQLHLTGRATQQGDLTVLGYYSHVLGCRSHCRLRNLTQIPEDNYQVTVVAPLPHIGVTTSLPKASSFSSVDEADTVVTNAAASVYAGQRCECVVTLTNPSTLPVQLIDVSVHSKGNKAFLEEVVVWQRDNITSQLPLLPGQQLCFTVYVQGVSTFLPHDKINENFNETGTSGGMTRSSSAQSSGQWAAAVAEVTSTDPTGTVVLDALLKLEYSGGGGLTSGWCRHCAVAVNVEIAPAVLITQWDVLPSQSASHCHLVLDVQNASGVEMTVTYSAGDENVRLLPKHCQRLLLIVPRFDPTTLPTPDADLSAAVSLHVSNCVDIQWTTAPPGATQPGEVSAEVASGRVSLESLVWSPLQLDELTVSPVSWAVIVNGQSGRPEVTVVAGGDDPVTINTRLTNNASCDMEECEVVVRCYQDLDTGVQDTKLEGKVVPLGLSHHKISMMASGSSHAIECAFIFLLPGKFHLQLACSGIRKKTLSHATDVKVVPKAAVVSEDKAVIEEWRNIPDIVVNVT